MVRQREGGGMESSSSSSKRLRCEDCGNRAKKECVYLRCRTCCKNKGFRCQTHVKSTWVPLYKRSLFHLHDHPDDDDHRFEQQQQQRVIVPIDQSHGHIFINPTKRLRPSSYPGLDPPDHQAEGKFPAEVNTVAKFQCLRVRRVEEMVDQHAYQTSVIIGGHVFRGILYDQGPAHHLHHMMMTTDPPPPPSSSSSYQFINPSCFN